MQPQISLGHMGCKINLRNTHFIGELIACVHGSKELKTLYLYIQRIVTVLYTTIAKKSHDKVKIRLKDSRALALVGRVNNIQHNIFLHGIVCNEFIPKFVCSADHFRFKRSLNELY